MALNEALEVQKDRLSHCVHCGFCLPVCPTYLQLGDEADSPRGRLHLMQAVVEGRLDPAADAFQTHLDRCLGCRACETVCPSGVEYGFLLERARARAIEARRPPPLVRVLLATMARPALRRVVLGVGRALRGTGLPALLARRLPAGKRASTLRTGMGMLATSRPVPIGRPVPSEGSREAARPEVSAPDPRGPAAPRPAGSRGRVGLLVGCVQEGLFSHVNRDTADVLRVNGWEVVEVPDQGCCGALHAHAGALEEARALARTNVEAFRSAEVDYVVSNAAGCGALLREMGELLEDPGAGAVAGRVRDVTELLVNGKDGEHGLVRGADLDCTVAYDAPCHLHHAQRVTEAPLRVLEAIPGVELRALPGAEECCGGAGIYGVTHRELGGRIGDRKVDAILQTGCEVVATGNPGCQMQIGSGLRARGKRLPVVHPIELLAESYRRAGWL